MNNPIIYSITGNGLVVGSIVIIAVVYIVQWIIRKPWHR